MDSTLVLDLGTQTEKLSIGDDIVLLEAKLKKQLKPWQTIRTRSTHPPTSTMNYDLKLQPFVEYQKLLEAKIKKLNQQVVLQRKRRITVDKEGNVYD